MISNLIFIHGSYSWETTFGLAIICFVLGFIFRYGLIYKQRKKILNLEDEMVNNHARILALEKKLNESKPDNQHPDLEVVSNKAS